MAIFFEKSIKRGRKYILKTSKIQKIRRYSISLIWKGRNNSLISYFFTKIVSKSHYSHDHILWKINWKRRYTIVKLSPKPQKYKKIRRYTIVSLMWKWQNKPLLSYFFSHKRVKITLLLWPYSFKIRSLFEVTFLLSILAFFPRWVVKCDERRERSSEGLVVSRLWFFKFDTHRKNKDKIIREKLRDT